MNDELAEIQAVRALKQLEKHRKAFEKIGQVARDKARVAGASAYFIDSGDPNHIVEEHPEGDRVRAVFDGTIRNVAAE